LYKRESKGQKNASPQLMEKMLDDGIPQANAQGTVITEMRTLLMAAK
jgi:hypothetical protein